MSDVPELIVNRPALPGSSDYLMAFGRIVMFIHLLVSITVIASTCREQMISFIVKRRTKTWEHVILTFFVYGGATFIAILFPDVINGFAFVGGTCAVLIVFSFPMALYVKQTDKRWY